MIDNLEELMKNYQEDNPPQLPCMICLFQGIVKANQHRLPSNWKIVACRCDGDCEATAKGTCSRCGGSY